MKRIFPFIFLFTQLAQASSFLLCDDVEFSNNLTKAVLKDLCSKDYKSEDWDELVDPEKEYEDLSLEEKYIYLLRFAKPGGYDEDHEISDHEYIHYLLMNDDQVVELFKKELLFANQQISLQESVDDRLDLLEDIFNEKIEMTVYDAGESCQSPKELEETKTKAFKMVYEEVKEFGIEEPLYEVPFELFAYASVLKLLPKEKQKEIINPTYRGLALQLTEETDGNLFISKSLLFTKNYVEHIFGNPLKDLTEVENNSYGHLILSSKPITSAPRNAEKASVYNNYGLHAVVAPESLKTFSWKTGNKQYKVKAKLIDDGILEAYVDDSKSPDYKRMWKDNKLTGLTLVSANFGADKQKWTEKYISYYVDQGFSFEAPTDIKDATKWIGDHISNGEVDYILKEAHSGGNDRDLVGLSKEHKLMKGVKKKSDGTEEVIYILMPQGDDYNETHRITFGDMNFWMTERKEKDQGPLFYLNSSCWSMETAKKEVMGIRSKDFIDIAATTKTTTFYNGKNSTKYHIIEGLRNGRTYEEMRKGMATTTRYQNGYNQYLFPDQEDYFEELSGGENEDAYEYNITDSSGRPYAIHLNR